MYQKFDILGINTSLKDKKVYIECTLDVDETSVTPDTITLVAKGTNRLMDTNFAVNGRIIELDLRQWPEPNVEYMIVVQTGVKSITDEPLSTALKRLIIFKSEVMSSVVIVSPSDHEEISAITMAWKEKPINNMPAINSYYLEIASENAFYNLVLSTNVFEKNEITLTSITAGQYYARVRAQDGDDYGPWSDVVTFLVKEDSPVVPTPTPGVDEPIYSQELEILSVPKNGETPSTFLIEFDEDIDMDGIEITVTRRNV